MKVEYFPTEMIIADLYTKRLQGKLFRLLRNLILNLCEEGIISMTFLEKLTKMEENTEDANHVKAV